MATKSYSKHKEYREYSSSGTVPAYTDEQFDMIKSDLLPKGSKLNSLDRNTGGKREYHYEYKEETLPGKYDRKDVHTVEEFTVPPRTPKSSETSSYYYEKEERDLPAVTSGTRTYNYETSASSTPGYSKVKSSKASKDLSHNVEELDSLLDDLQKDQERQLYKGGYTSDTAETSSFDYRRGTPVKPASSGYSTLKREEHLEKSSWTSSPLPPPVRSELKREEHLEKSSWTSSPIAAPVRSEVRQEVFREEKSESRVVPAVSPAPAALAPLCQHCHHVGNTGTLPRSSTPMNKVTTTVKTYTYEVPADTDPASVPIPLHANTDTEYITTDEKIHTTNTLKSSPSSPRPVQWAGTPTGCHYCAHCNSHIREYRTHHTDSTDVTDRSERIVYPKPANETKLVPPSEPHNGHGPYGPTSYKYSETTYSSSNERYPVGGPGRRAPSPAPAPSAAPFPRSTTPSPGNQQPPKRLDDLMADFPEARFPTQTDGVTRRKVEVTHENQTQQSSASPRDSTPRTPVVGNSKNVAGPAVYYPPGHTPFAKKDAALVGAGGGGGYEASSAMSAGGGRYASGRGMYEYESGARSTQKHSETKTAVPVCLPLCCAMPCVIM